MIYVAHVGSSTTAVIWEAGALCHNMYASLYMLPVAHACPTSSSVGHSDLLWFSLLCVYCYNIHVHIHIGLNILPVPHNGISSSNIV